MPSPGLLDFVGITQGQSKNIWIKPATSDNVSIFTLTPNIDEIRKDRYERV